MLSAPNWREACKRLCSGGIDGSWYSASIFFLRSPGLSSSFWWALADSNMEFKSCVIATS